MATPVMLIGNTTPKNSTYAGMTAPKGYEFGKVDNNQQMWAGNQLVAFRPLQAVQPPAASQFGQPGVVAGIYGSLKKPSAPAAPAAPPPVIQGGTALLTGNAGQSQGPAQDEQQMWKGNKLVPFKAGAKVAPTNGTTILLGD
jgi:hypothetical protein